MASDNTTLNAASGGDTIRAVAKTANSPAKTQIVVLDVGGGADGSAETALSAGPKTSANSLSYVPASDLASVEPAGLAISGASMPTGGAGLTGWLSAIWKTLQSGLARSWTLSSATDSVAVSATSLPLPTGAALDASVLAVKTALGAPFQAGGSIGNASFGATQSGTWSTGRTWTLASGTDSVTATISGAPTVTVGNASLAVTGTFWPTTQPVSLASLPALAAGANAIGSVTVSGVERWVAGSGQGLAWGSAFGAEINSIVSGNAILSSVVIANGTALDTYMDVSAAIGSITTASGAPYLGLYLHPLNQDGSTYGDGRFGSSAAGPPSSNYYVGQIPLIPSVTQAQEGSATGIVIPPGSFKLVLYNLAGATLASSSNTISYRTYNRAIH